jgi:hypothetical protein
LGGRFDRCPQADGFDVEVWIMVVALNADWTQRRLAETKTASVRLQRVSPIVKISAMAGK